MIGILNRLVDEIEDRLIDEIDIDALAASLGRTGYHSRRMFSALAGMPISEYVRRRRKTVAASDVIGGEDLLMIAVRYAYGPVKAYGRAFRSVQGVSRGDVRRDGAPLRLRPTLRFGLTVEGSSAMDARIIERPAFRLIGHAAQVPLLHRGANPHLQQHIASLLPEEHERLKALSRTDPPGLLQVSADVDSDFAEGRDLTQLHGVAVEADSAVAAELDVIDVPAGAWDVMML